MYVCGTKQSRQQPQCGIISNMPLQKYFCTACTLQRVERHSGRLSRLDSTWFDLLSSAQLGSDLSLAELDDSLICWQLAYNWRLMDGVLHCRDTLRAASAQFLYFSPRRVLLLFFNYFKNKCRIHLNYWYILLCFYLLQKPIKVKNSLLRLKLFQKLKLNINNSATWLWQFL